VRVPKNTHWSNQVWHSELHEDNISENEHEANERDHIRRHPHGQKLNGCIPLRKKITLLASEIQV
jgi:hypothetical protein